ncbi:MAG TPA: carboxylating nicotinate-nucleotide diphosphorylase [Actinomycetota bacterium]|nr:carboxylating nicotinate-nucleotide diphosphorylase [Actinomycetota bacterium]
MPDLPLDTDEIVARALREDLGAEGDVTSRVSLQASLTARARIEGRAEGVLAGLAVARRVVDAVDPAMRFDARLHDGDRVAAGDVVATIDGGARSIMAAERTALNFLTHLSGIATAAREFVEACAGTESVILCTRKTLPGLRSLERYAVECGGGRLHRAGLHDGVLLKDNHVALAGGVREAVVAARANAPHTLRVEVEVESLEQLGEAIDAGADAILLDNADADTVRKAVDLVGERVPLEISGGMTVDRVREIAPLGRLLISVGRITHSAPALDLALEIEPAG